MDRVEKTFTTLRRKMATGRGNGNHMLLIFHLRERKEDEIQEN